MDTWWEPVLLVIATGAVSIAVAWQQNRFARRRALEDRQNSLEDRRREAARDASAALLAELNEIAQTSLDARNVMPQRSAYADAVNRARGTYLLIPDAATRDAIADGLTVISAAEARDVAPGDFREAVLNASFVLAAYMRGDEAPGVYVTSLKSLRLKYPSGRTVTDWMRAQILVSHHCAFGGGAPPSDAWRASCALRGRRQVSAAAITEPGW